ncbi:hypothetical protein BsWGS_24036 [Bradybaena similaris]
MAFDMCSLIVSSLHPEEEDKVLTADEVISQIDDMMKEPSPGDYYGALRNIPEDEAYTKVKKTLASLSAYTHGDLKDMSQSTLRELVAEYDGTTKMLSEMLVSELDLRDELQFEKELKDHFISLLLIHKKRQKSRSERKKRISKGWGTVMSLVKNKNGHFLTTAIPYYPSQGSPTSEQLQIYIKILQAINEDSSNVPTLLIDYILKVLCPT